MLRYIRVSFTTASGMAYVNSSPTCMTNGISSVTGQPQFTTSPVGSPIIPCYITNTATGFDVVLSNLVIQEPVYDLAVTGIYNAPSAKTVNDISCAACYDENCDPAVAPPDPWPENKDAKISPLTFKPGVQYANSITVKSGNLKNSATDATTSFKVIIANKLPKESRVVLTFGY
jgi:hypothetical protein